jgi:broad-specificity NMP kinase
MEKYLIIMAGLPGTGKTSTTKRLSQYLEGYTPISQNDLRRKAGMKKMPKTFDNILRQIDIETRNLLDDNQGVIIDSVNRYLFRRHQLYGVASCCGKKVITIECVCSEKEAKKRMRNKPMSDGLLSDPRDTHIWDKLANSWESIEKDFQYPGEEHVSYIQFDTEKLKVNKKAVQAGMGRFINKIEKILLEKK